MYIILTVHENITFNIRIVFHSIIVFVVFQFVLIDVFICNDLSNCFLLVSRCLIMISFIETKIREVFILFLIKCSIREFHSKIRLIKFCQFVKINHAIL